MFWCLPKGLPNRRYSNTLFLPTRASADPPILHAQLGVFMHCQKSFQIEDIQICCSCPLLKAQILQFLCAKVIKTRCFSCLPKSISNRRYSNMLFLPTPASADLAIVCAKLGVFMPCQRHFKQKIFKYIRRKFRSQTSDNMDRWKAEQGRGREKRKIRREKIREEKEPEERRCRCAKR